jgi:hypothetical protein
MTSETTQQVLQTLPRLSGVSPSPLPSRAKAVTVVFQGFPSRAKPFQAIFRKKICLFFPALVTWGLGG